MFKSTPFIISNFLGPESVTNYAIHSHFFSVSAIIIAFFTQPLWSGYGDAYYGNDHKWIKNTFRRMRYIWMAVILLLTSMMILQKPIFALWLHGRIGVNYRLSLLLVIYNIMFAWTGIYNLFLNATSKLRLQLYLNSFMAVLFLVLAWTLVKVIHFGVEGVVAALILSTIPAFMLYPIQCQKILNRAGGIWEK